MKSIIPCKKVAGVLMTSACLFKTQILSAILIYANVVNRSAEKEDICSENMV
jgi:hypothetical protein